jgi:hypothetical protein
MLTMQRVYHDDDGTLTDLSREVSDFLASTASVPIVAADDKMYIGSDIPFFYRYFDFGTANTAASVVSVEIWDGTTWNSAVDVIDETSTGGATFGQSGLIRWACDRNESWALEETTEDIAALSTLKIYRKYWARLSFSGDLDAGTTLNYVGFKFANDNDLGARYPDLNTSAAKSAWASGKTDWNDQHFEAAEEIIKDMRQLGRIQRADQIIEPGEFREAAVHKCAEIIMHAYGDEYEDNRARASKKYSAALPKNIAQLDKDGDGHIDDMDKFKTSGFSRF